MPRSEAPLLEVRDLRVRYLSEHSAARAVDGVSFSIAPGEMLGLAGESGSGKSTVAMAIPRVLRPPALITGGEVRFRGTDLLELDDGGLRRLRWAEIAMVFQSAMNALNPVLTIGDQVADVMTRGHGHDPVEQRVGGLLRTVGIDPSRQGSYPHELSGGMRQRAVIAMAMALQPSLVIMDEPTTALDVVVQRDILEQIAELRARLGFAVLFITHDLSLLARYADRIAIMYAGELVEVAPATTLMERARHPYTQGLLDSSPSVRGVRRILHGIRGAPPDLTHPPSGCRFHPRCPHALPICAERAPAAVQLSADHHAACHLLVEPVRA